MPLSRKKTAVSLAEKVISRLMRNRCAWTIREELWDHADHRVACAPGGCPRETRPGFTRQTPALYYAKKQVVTVWPRSRDPVQQDVFVKRYDSSGRVPLPTGKTRSLQWPRVSGSSGQRESQFLNREGLRGMGKSMFLETFAEPGQTNHSAGQAQASPKSFPAYY